MNKLDKFNYDALIAAVQLLAMPCKLQVEALPSFVSVPDEVALIFDDAYKAARHVVESLDANKNAINLLNDLDSALDRMSENSELWSLQALDTDSEWGKCRLLAKDILESLNEPFVSPKLEFIQFVK